MTTIEKKMRALYGKLFCDYACELRRAVGNSKTLLDVGCGVDSPVQLLPRSIHKTGVDIFKPSLEISKEKGIHEHHRNVDVLAIQNEFSRGEFDCVFASELIEHLEKDDGFTLLRQMEYVAKKCVVVTTPVGFLPQPATETNPWQLHRSGWSVEEMHNRGYKVFGLNGAKFVWNMKFLWKKYDDAPILIRLIRKILVVITQVFVRNNPKYAFQMMCVKHK